MQCRTSYSCGASSQPQSPNSRLAHLTTRDNSAEIQAHSFFHKSELFLTSNQWRGQSPLSSAFLQPPPHLISIFHLSHLFSPSSSWSSEHNVFLLWFIQFYPHPTPQTKSRHLPASPRPTRMTSSFSKGSQHLPLVQPPLRKPSSQEPC